MKYCNIFIHSTIFKLVKMNIKLVGISLSLVLLLTAASTSVLLTNPVLPTTPYNYSNISLPTAFTTGGRAVTGVDNTPADNAITDAGATLGRVLFYDKNLSFNRTIACASCHKQNAAFSDPSVLSLGFAGGMTGKLKEDKAVLEWQTAQEIDNDYFTIEKSLDGKQWGNIGQQRGAGNSKSIQKYVFNDVNLVEGVQYYRLRQTDFDKRFTHSKVISIRVNTLNPPKIRVYSNPSTHQVTINLDDSSLNNTTELQVINASGQVIFTKNKGINSSETINLSAFPNGQYIVLIKANGKVISQKLIKN